MCRVIKALCLSLKKQQMNKYKNILAYLLLYFYWQTADAKVLSIRTHEDTPATARILSW